jgi:hypothetical protein
VLPSWCNDSIVSIAHNHLPMTAQNDNSECHA